MSYLAEPVVLRAVSVAMPTSYQESATIAALASIPVEIVESRFGLRGKYVAAADESLSDLTLAAARGLLAHVEPEEIDAVIYFGSPFKEYQVWMMAPKLQHLLPAPRAVAFEVAAVSAGFPIALRVATDMLAANPAWRSVVLVGGSVESRLIDYSNERSRFMFNFGDGAAAALLQKGGAGGRVLGSAFLTDGSFHDFVKVPPGSSYVDVTDPAAMKARLDPVSLPRFVEVAERAVAASGRRLTDIGLLLPLHTKRSLYEALLGALGLTAEQGVYLDQYGHMSAIDPLVGLYEAQRQGKLRDGQLVLFLSAGTGYTWAATCMEWRTGAS